VTCVVLFVFSLIVQNAELAEGEETLLVFWCVWQILRVILIAKKQRLAK
jgi:hypothetical protein